MKKLSAALITFILATLALSVTALAYPGSMGFFGGITEGVRLPRTSDGRTMTSVIANFNAPIISPYKEVIFIDGKPVEFEGQITVVRSAGVTAAPSGAFTMSLTVGPSAATNPGGPQLNRAITFAVSWDRPAEGQVRKNFSAIAWTETITVGESDFTLDFPLSHFEISVLENHNPGVIYYRGTSSKRAVFNGRDTTIESTSQFWGFVTAWSYAEGHVVDSWLFHDGWQMNYQVRPSVSAFNTLQFAENLPFLISFHGNYQEVLTTESGLAWNIFTYPAQLSSIPHYGTASLATTNIFEQLRFTDVSMWEPHWALQDISILYALDVLDMPVAMFNPASGITRAQFVNMLVRALRLPLEPIPTTPSRRTDIEVIVFPDITRERPADYQHVMAAWEAGLVTGRGGGMFRPDDLLTLEEAVQMVMNAIGLLRLGVEPTNVTPFADDADISPWARQALYAARRIGLISMNADGTINSRQYLNKAAAAAIVNRMIDYMRTELLLDYTEHIVHFPW